jgi:hypothetical protein
MIPYIPYMDPMGRWTSWKKHGKVESWSHVESLDGQLCPEVHHIGPTVLGHDGVDVRQIVGPGLKGWAWSQVISVWISWFHQWKITIFNGKNSLFRLGHVQVRKLLVYQRVNMGKWWMHPDHGEDVSIISIYIIIIICTLCTVHAYMYWAISWDVMDIWPQHGI